MFFHNAAIIVYFFQLQSKHFVKPTILVTLASLSLISENKKVKMSEENTELTDVLTHADQLYDENHYHEAYELLKKFSVSILIYCILYIKNLNLT